MTQYNQIPLFNKLDDDDDEEDYDKSLHSLLGIKPKPYQQYEHSLTTSHVHFYLSTLIKGPHNYTDMIHRMNVALPQDVIYIHLNTPGGDLSTGVQIINAMKNSEAKIVTIIEGMVYSLGTLIFLSGDEMVVNDHCMLMFHNFRGGLAGPGHELTSQLDATVKWFNILARQIYLPFLTEDELSRIIKGEDIWMNSTDVHKRLDRMVKILNEQQTPKPRKPRTPKTTVDNSV